MFEFTFFSFLVCFHRRIVFGVWQHNMRADHMRLSEMLDRKQHLMENIASLAEELGANFEPWYQQVSQ